ncbi:protogenin-like isoform X2 [Limulus polyphemus]|uniref:Protogenin-like isoform X2 n=1 Tax=Limulus polyphemus TaxID=6850 RepID=A0ABM1T005_LIMPO|nr:protogenin-like isoform X2 [Limulus polyphemus]
MALETLSLSVFITIFNTVIKASSSINLTLGFTEHPVPPVIAQRNQPLLVNCTVFSEPEYGPAHVSWFYQGHEIDDSRRQVLQNGSLYFDRVLYQRRPSGKKDEGDYTCLVQNNVGAFHSSPVRLVVARMEREYSLQPQPLTVEGGGVARFLCQISAVPPAVITWQRDGQDLPQNESRYTLLDSGILQITDISSDDQGLYRCIASNPARTRPSSYALLTVKSATLKSLPIQFLSLSQSVVKVVNETAVLECMVTGKPMPVVSWKRADGKKLSNERVSLLGQGNLVLHSLRAEDAGSYVCTATVTDFATGKMKSEIQSSTLTVYVTPRFIERPVSIVKPTPQTARFLCIVNGTPPPSVQWLKNGKPMYLNGRIKFKTDGELVISQTMISDSGIYQCVASNKAGTRSVAARLFVKSTGVQPDTPHNLKAQTLTSTSVLLSWKPPTTNSKNIKAYTVHFAPFSGGLESQVVAVNTTEVITKLTPYTNYSFYVRAYSEQSASEQSEIIYHLTGEDVPTAAPSITLTSLSSTTLRVSVEPLPPHKARGKIISYRIHYRRHNQVFNNVIEVDGDITEYTITGLQPKQKYDVRVLAVTKVGYPALTEQNWPWVTQEMPETLNNKVPLPPTLHLTVINATTLQVRWQVTEDPRYPIEGYRLSYREQGHPLEDPINLESYVNEFLLSNLDPYTWYEVHILGFNEYGDGLEAVQNILTVSEDHPDLEIIEIVAPPQLIEAHPKSPSTVQVVWKPPMTSRNISYYTVRFHPALMNGLLNASMVSYIRSISNSVIITGLTAFTLYEFSVRSHDVKNQQGPFSQKVECRTLEDVPSSPLDLSWLAVNAHAIKLFWQPPATPNGEITMYEILYTAQTGNAKDLDDWQKKEENGFEVSSLIEGLASNTRYFFCMQAWTKAGVSSPSATITVNIPVKLNNTRNSHQEVLGVHPQDPLLGIILGISIGLACIIICILIIICRKRCCPHPPPPPSGTYSSRHANGQNGHPPCFHNDKQPHNIKPQELDCFTPMLNHIPNTEVDNHLDTKGGYYDMRSHKVNGFTHPLLPNSRNILQMPGKSEVRITENPQCITGTTEDCLPIPKNRLRYKLSDAKVHDEWIEYDDHLSTTPSQLQESDNNNPEQIQASTRSEAKETHSRQHFDNMQFPPNQTPPLRQTSLPPTIFAWDSLSQT